MTNKISTLQSLTTSFSMEALAFLAKQTSGTTHLTIYNDLISSMAIDDEMCIKRGITVNLNAGQCEASTLSLAKKWKMSRKTITRILREMERLGIIRLSPSKLTTVVDLSSVESWQTDDGTRIPNPLRCSPSERVHAQVEKAAVLPTGTTTNEALHGHADDVPTPSVARLPALLQPKGDTAPSKECSKSFDRREANDGSIPFPSFDEQSKAMP